jgi:hypothetical protein
LPSQTIPQGIDGSAAYCAARRMCLFQWLQLAIDRMFPCHQKPHKVVSFFNALLTGRRNLVVSFINIFDYIRRGSIRQQWKIVSEWDGNPPISNGVQL